MKFRKPIRQPVVEKENSELNPVLVGVKIDLQSQSARAIVSKDELRSGVVRWTSTYGPTTVGQQASTLCGHCMASRGLRKFDNR